MSHAVTGLFGTVDSVVFAVMLILSSCVGIWYAIVDRRKANSQEYLMGGRSMSVFPVAMSAWHGFLSAITLLGTPVETYKYGTQYVMIALSFFAVIPATAYFYVPVFYNLRLTSAYEYLGLRFHPYIRTLGSAIYFFHMTMYMPIVLYAPALALSEVTGISIWTAVFSTGLVCTFYTSIGGVKAVVWTDCFQSIIMYGSVLVVVVKGALDLGGFEVVWQRSIDSRRVEFFRFDLDPTIRHTFWSLIVGGYITWMGMYAASQSMVQRYLTVKTLRDAQSVVWLNLPAVISLLIIACFSGLVVYAYYYDCDPIGVKMIQAPDQLFPRFVMETLGAFPGLPGLFVAGVFSGAISTVATGVNSLAAITLEDFIKIYIAKDLTEKKATRISKSISLIFGLVCILLTFVAAQLGGILQAALTVNGVVGGPMLGVFTLGMFFPCANTWGASVGLVSGFSIALWLAIGSFITKPYSPVAPVSYSGCTDLYYNATGIDVSGIEYIPQVHKNNDGIFYMYRFSYLWLCAIGFAIVIVVGLVFSLVTGCTRGKPVDRKLISPLILWLCKYKPFDKLLGGQLSSQKIFSLETKEKAFTNNENGSRTASISSIKDSKIS